MFQSTHPHGVRPRILRTGICPQEFQSTHPHGVRQPKRSYSGKAKSVSIHAPTRGATQFARRVQCRIGCFNPRTHTGCDFFKRFFLPVLRVSIHAPTRGATYAVRVTYQHLHVSIHAPTRGATKLFDIFRSAYGFQSTHPHGVRRNACKQFTPENCFNPRTHTGCDCIFSKCLNINLIR